MALTPAQIKAIKGLLLAVSLWLWVANQGGHGQEQPREGSVGEGLPVLATPMCWGLEEEQQPQRAPDPPGVLPSAPACQAGHREVVQAGAEVDAHISAPVASVAAWLVLI